MSVINEKLEAIRKLLFNEQPASPAPVVPLAPAPVAPVVFEMKDYLLADGTAVQIDNLAIGGQVVIAGIPAPDGDYSLEDGSEFKVMAGLISEMKEKAPEPVEQVQAPQAPALMKADFEAELQKITARFEAQEKANKLLIDLLTDMQKFEVAKPIEKQVVDWDQMSELQKRRATK